MSNRHSLAFAALAFAGISPELRANNTYDVVWDGTLSASWVGGNDFQSRMTLGTSPAGEPAVGMALPPLVVDFTASKAFQVTLSAPEGRSIVITPPDTPLGVDETRTILEFSLASGTGPSGPYYEGTLDNFSFIGLEGEMPIVDGTFNYASGTWTGAPPILSVNFQVEIFGPISFESLIWDLTAPANLEIDGDFETEQFAELDVFWEGIFTPETLIGDEGEYAPPPSQPANWVSLSPVPEPSTYGLMLGGLALVGAAIVRRRKAKA
jgi:hypothetical protein